MTDKEAIAIIRKEILCVSRDCDIERSCGSCDLVMPDREPIIEAYKIAIESLENQKTLQEELEKIYEEVEAVKLTASKISNGYECYGVENKTAKEMRTEILDIIYEHIKENKEK